jgi:phosphoribosylglycinamide formyltransferase-1
MKMPIAVLVSGSGSNLQAVIDRIEQGVLDAEICLVFSNKEGAYGLERARRHGLPTRSMVMADFSDRIAYDRAMVEVIRGSGAELVVLAGFMHFLSPVVVHAFENRILNIHPSLLPGFPGVRAQRQQAEYGVSLAGCTVHFVDEEMDNGPIIIQAAVPVLPGDDEASLGERILSMEHRILPQAIQWVAQGRVFLDGRGVVVNQDETSAFAGNLEHRLVNPRLERGF